MKTTIILLIVFFQTIFLAAQTTQIGHDLTIFSEDGVKFKVILNGQVMNEVPASRVFCENLNNDWLKCIIQFEDSKIPTIERKVLQLKSASNPNGLPEAVVYQIKEKEGKYTLRWSSASLKKIQQTQTIIIQPGQQPAPQPGIQINTNIVIPKQ